MDKPFLFNGTPRSGTAYLGDYLRWRFGNDKYLSEPLTSPLVAARLHSELKDLILKRHPLLTTSLPRYWLFYNENLLENFMEGIKGYQVKEVSLHRFLNSKMVRDNWEVFHIIRDPVSVCLSFKEMFVKDKSYGALEVLSWLNKTPLSSLYRKFREVYDPFFAMAKIYLSTRLESYDPPGSFEESFFVVWILSNHEALEAVGEERLLIYNKPETLKKVPMIEKFMKEVRPFKPRIRKDEKLEELLRRTVRKYELEEEFEKLEKLLR